MEKKQPLRERFQQLAGIKPLYEQEDEDLRLEPEYGTPLNPNAVKDLGMDIDGLRLWMMDLEEEIQIYVPDLYPSKLGESTPKVHKKFPEGATNIGYTLQGWLDEFSKKYPEAIFDFTDDRKDTLKVVDTRDLGINLKWFDDVESSEASRVDNTPPPGSWRKSDNMGNLTDPWS